MLELLQRVSAIQGLITFYPGDRQQTRKIRLSDVKEKKKKKQVEQSKGDREELGQTGQTSLRM